MKRVIFDIVLFLSLFTLPWWITFVLVFAGIFVFKNYYEFIIVWIMMYSLFSVPNDRIITHPVFVSIAIGVVYIGIEALKDNMILYKNEI